MPLTRRDFAASLAAAPLLAQSSTGVLKARIKIDTERTIAAIDKKIYGNFIEHLGRCIEGGVFAEGSPLSDPQGYRKDVREAVKNLNVSLLRWPGGNFASNYDWRDGIGPRDQRPARLEMAWHTVEDNRFGTHEFLNYCEEMGIEPYVCVNLGTGSWDLAQSWVEYCNLADGTAMTELRKKNGRAKPWNVKYWSLGNEMDGPWQMGHRSAEDYGKFALEAAKLMKWTDPDIQLVAAGSSNFNPGADWTGWNKTVLEYLRHHADYLSLHTYVGNRGNDYYEFLASSLELTERTRIAEGIIRAALTSETPARKIYIAWDEWNVWYRARGQGLEAGRLILEEKYNLEDALVVATMLNTFVNNAHIVKIANMAQLVNVIAPIFTDDKRLYLQTIYYPLQLFAANSHGMALELFTDSPTYTTKHYDAVPYLDASATYNNGSLVVNLVNRHRDQPLTLTLQMEDRKFRGGAAVSEVNGPDIKSENSFDGTKVNVTKRSAPGVGSTLQVQLSPHSYTMLKVGTAA